MLSVKGAAVALGLLFIGAGAAWATIPSGNGQIKGCYQKNSGSLRVVDSAGSCLKSEVALSWNQTGPTGATGPSGSASVIMTGGSGNVTPDGQNLVLLSLPAGAYALRAIVGGSNPYAYGVVVNCFVYSSVEGTGIGYQVEITRGPSTFLTDISPGSDLDSYGQVVLQGAFTVATDTTIRLWCFDDSDHHSVTGTIPMSANVIIEPVGSVTLR